MSYFLGIAPPEKIYAEVQKIQHQFGDNRIEPHITVRPPVTPTNIDSWINAAAEVAAQLSPFNVSLIETGKFRNDVLFIGIESEELNVIQYQLAKALKPFDPENKQPDRAYHPHLTLGRKRYGFTEKDFAEMEILTGQWLKQNPVSFPVLSLRIYYKPNSTSKYTKLEDLPFLTHPGV